MEEFLFITRFVSRFLDIAQHGTFLVKLRATSEFMSVKSVRLLEAFAAKAA
jgi:hypothetical protein